MTVCNGDNGAILLLQHGGVGAISSDMIIHQPDPILALCPIHDVLPLTNPTDPIPLGFTLSRRIPKRDKETPIAGVCGRVTIACQSSRKFSRVGPTATFIFTEDDKRVSGAAVLSHQQGDGVAVGGSDEPRLTEVDIRAMSNRDRF